MPGHIYLIWPNTRFLTLSGVDTGTHRDFGGGFFERVLVGDREDLVCLAIWVFAPSFGLLECFTEYGVQGEGEMETLRRAGATAPSHIGDT